MGATWTAEQVLALAPDSSSVSAAKALATPAKWSSTGAAESLLWGLCQGSGKTPYQTVVDLGGPAYKCSCPSRKFPCKHALALMLTWSAGQVPDAAEPADFAKAWRDSREERAAKPVKPRGERDEAGAAKRAEQRATRVADGLQELDRWLKDQVRGGLASTAQRGYRHFDTVAARMVDAQAPGIAGTLRQLASVPTSGEGWPARLLGEYAMLHLLVRAHENLPDLPADLAAVVRSRVGYTVSREDVLATPAVNDGWHVVASRDLLDGKIATRRVWLAGTSIGRFALLLLFSPGNNGFGGSPDADLVPGTVVTADLHFYPGQQRAVVGTRYADPAVGGRPARTSTIAEVQDAYAAALETDPWLTAFPAVVEATPEFISERWQLRDEAGLTVPLITGSIDPWRLLAVSGGHPVAVAGEWTPRGLVPLTTWADDSAVML